MEEAAIDESFGFEAESPEEQELFFRTHSDRFLDNTDLDCVFHEASHNLNSLETIVEETSDDLRSDLSEDDVPLSDCHNSINSWIDSELDNESNSSSKDNENDQLQRPDSEMLQRITRSTASSSSCMKYTITESSVKSGDLEYDYLSRSSSLVQFETLEKLYEDCYPAKSVLSDSNQSTSLPSFQSTLSGQECLEEPKMFNISYQSQLHSDKTNFKFRLNQTVTKKYSELRCDSDDDMGFYDRNKTGKTSNQKSRKCSNENLSEDSGFCSDHAISKKLSCQFQPYDKEEFFIYNKNFASTNFGTSCQNLTMLSDREPSTKFFHSKNSNTRTSNGCQSRDFGFGFSFSQFDTISETYLSGKNNDNERKSQLEADVLSLDTNGTPCETAEVTTTETLTPTLTLTPIRSTKSEPSIWLQFDQLVDNYTNSNAFIDFSEFLFDSNRHKSKSSHSSRLSKSVDSLCLSSTSWCGDDKNKVCDNNSRTNMTSPVLDNRYNLSSDSPVDGQIRNQGEIEMELERECDNFFNSINAINHKDEYSFQFLQNNDNFKAPTTRRNVKSTSNLAEFVSMAAAASKQRPSANFFSTSTKSVHFCPIVSQVQLNDVDESDNGFDSDKDQKSCSSKPPSDYVYVNERLSNNESHNNSCATLDEIDGNRRDEFNVDNKTTDNIILKSDSVDKISSSVSPTISILSTNSKNSNSVTNKGLRMPVATTNDRPARKGFGGFLTRLASFRFKKKQSHKLKNDLEDGRESNKNRDKDSTPVHVHGSVGKRISGDDSRHSDEFLFIPLKKKESTDNGYNQNNNNYPVTENGSKGTKQIKGKPPLPVRIVGACVKKKSPPNYDNVSDAGVATSAMHSLMSPMETPRLLHHSENIDRKQQQKQLPLSEFSNNANFSKSTSMDPFSTEMYSHEDNGNGEILGLIETDLDTDVTVITSSNGGATHVKTRSLMNLGLDQNHLTLRSVDQVDFMNPDRPHKSMEFLLDKDNLKSVEPPENELRKVTGTGDRTMSEHELRVQRSLQKLTLPEWYKPSQIPSRGFLLRRQQHQEQQQQQPQKPKQKQKLTTASRSDRDEQDRSHNRTKLNSTDSNNQSYFNRWSTSKLNSTYTAASSPCPSTRSSFSYHNNYRNSNNSMSQNQTFSGFSSSARSSFNERKPYLGWRSQERLNLQQNNYKMPRTPSERLALSLYPSATNSGQIDNNTSNPNDIQSSIKEVTSAIVNYCGLSDGRQSDSSNSSLRNSKQFHWVESSFIGSKPMHIVPNSNSVNRNHNNNEAVRTTNSISSRPSTPTSAGSPVSSSASSPVRVPMNEIVVNQYRRSIGSATLDEIVGSLLGLKPKSPTSKRLL